MPENMEDNMVKVRKALTEATDEVRESFETVCKEFKKLASINEISRNVLLRNNSTRRVK